MIAFGLLPVLLGGVVGAVAPRTAARLQPRAAAMVLTALTLIVALCTGLVLSVLGVLGVAQLLPDVAPADWSTRVLRHGAPVPTAVCLAAALVVTVMAANALRHAVGVVRELRRAHQTAAALPAHGDLVVADDESLFAYAVPGRPGRVVVSTALLGALTATQRQALLAHERSHLRHRHFVYTQATRLAAAANPLLRPVCQAVDVAVERWADSDAAAAVGDARTVAHAIGAASLQRRRAPAPALGAGGSAVVERVRYLLDPPRVNRGIAWLPVVIAVASCVGTGIAALDVRAVVEAAESLG